MPDIWNSAWMLMMLGLVVGCGARGPLDSSDWQPPVRDDIVDAGSPDTGPEDAGPEDAGLVMVEPDSGLPDAGMPDTGVPDAGPVTVCRRDAECVSGVCRAEPGLVPTDLTPLPLVCAAEDGGLQPVNGTCRFGEDCGRGICVLAGVCVQPCVSDTDCAPEDRCAEVYATTSRRSLQPLQACVARLAVPEDVSVSRTSLPALRSGLPSTFTLSTVSPNQLVMFQAANRDTQIFFTFVRALGGAGVSSQVLYDGTEERTPSSPTPTVGISPTTISASATLLYPNGPEVPAVSGGLEITMVSFENTELEEIVLQRSRSATTLDFDFYLVGGGNWMTPSGAVPPQLTREMVDVERLLSSVGISVGELRVHEVVGGLRTRFEVLEDLGDGLPADLPVMYRLSAGQRSPSISVFFVRMIDGALGIASGIPGVHGVPGTGASGVAIAVDSIDRGLPEVLVHEIGHFLGLFHTSESDGTINDPFTDTPECRSDNDVDSDGFVAPFECTMNGADNLMFWTGEGRNISEQQAVVMRRALMLR